MQRELLSKMLMVGALALALLVPVTMIRDLVSERQARRDAAVEGIARGWGGRQTVTGPYLAVPYERHWIEVTQDSVDGVRRERRSERREARVLRIAPESIEWSIESAARTRSRGIYAARLYEAHAIVRGRIAIAPRFGLADGDGRLRFGTPRLVLGVSDARGVRDAGPLAIGEATVDFVPGAGDEALAAGVHAPLPALDATQPRTLEFAFTLGLAGAETLALAPLAREARVRLRSDWPHPSFQGEFLPAAHSLRPDGFEADWRVSRYAAQAMARLAACPAHGACAALASRTIGVSFIEPVGLYAKLERAAKYGFLFVGLVFAAFFLFETTGRLAIHPVQYALVGLALAMFFLLLTALSEHVDFALAYLAAALACVGLIGAYLAQVLASRARAAAFCAALGALYAVLYLLLRAEDHALLAGTGLLFALLAATMLATRRVDWSALAADGASGRRPPAEAAPANP